MVRGGRCTRGDNWEENYTGGDEKKQVSGKNYPVITLLNTGI